MHEGTGVKKIQRALIWSGGLRLAHGLIALSVLVLAGTGWLIKLAPSVADAASGLHRLSGFALTLGLVLRIYLLFADTGTAHWRELRPARTDLHKVGMMLRFYLSLGRTPLPRWYAHNPLWMPLYVLILLILALQAATGLMMETWPLLAGFYLPAVHDFWAPVILGFSGLHIIAVVLQDARGTTSDTSAMINGHRIFVIESTDTLTRQDVQSVPLEQIRKEIPGHSNTTNNQK